MLLQCIIWDNYFNLIFICFNLFLFHMFRNYNLITWIVCNNIFTRFSLASLRVTFIARNWMELPFSSLIKQFFLIILFLFIFPMTSFKKFFLLRKMESNAKKVARRHFSFQNLFIFLVAYFLFEFRTKTERNLKTEKKL